MVMASKTEATGTTSPTFRAMLRLVIGPLAAQTISGTVKCQVRAQESNTGANATGAMSVKLVQPDGTDRAVLLGANPTPSASDSATAGNEMATSLTNCTFKNASEVAAQPLTSQAATAGDYLVIELGFRSATTTSRNVTLNYGNDNATDLPEDTSTTTANNPWVELSQTLAWVYALNPQQVVGAAEAVGRASAAQRAAADTVAAADAYGRLAPANRLAADLLALIDAVSLTSSGPAGSAYDLAASEKVGGSEVFRRVSAAARPQADALGLSDPPLVRTAIVDRLLSAHLLGMVEAYARTATGKRAVQELAGLTEGTIRALTAIRLIVDSAFGATDAAQVVKQGAFLLAVAELLGTLEAFARLAPAARSYAQSAGLQDPPFSRTTSAAVSLTPDSLAAADATNLAGAANRLASDSVSTADAYARQSAALRTAADVLALADAAALVKKGSQLIAVADLLGLVGGSALTTGLAAYYRFDNSLADATTNGNALAGPVTFAPGKLGQGMAAGTASRSPLAGLTLASGSAPFTLSAWLKGAAADFSGAGGNVTLADPQLIVVRVSGGSGAGQTLSFDFGDDSLVAPLGTVPNGGWAHGALTWDGATCRAYVNGAFLDTLSPSAWGGAAVTLTADPDGNDATTPVDEVAVYARALTAAEVAQLYNGGAAFDPTANPTGVARLVTGFRRAADSVGAADALVRRATFVLKFAESLGLADAPTAFLVTGGFVVASPAHLPANHAGGVRLTYSGNGTSWTGATTFTPSGIPGVTYSPANVLTPTLADQVVQVRDVLGVDPAGPTGTLTVTCSDGTQGAIPVVAVGLAVSPDNSPPGSTPAVTLTGTGALYVSADSGVAELFTVAGGTGSAITTTGRPDDTHATATLTVGSAEGPLTITDVTTGATAAFTAGSPFVAGDWPTVRVPGRGRTVRAGARRTIKDPRMGATR